MIGVFVKLRREFTTRRSKRWSVNA